jgi:RNA 2',3'-cyclic 3'-phosphodiesterase
VTDRGDVRRLFVSVDPPTDAVAHLGTVVDSLEVSRANAPGRSTRLAGRDRWHVTLAFIGDVPAARVADAARALELAAAPAEPLRVSFAGGGTFGRSRFTVLWCGLDGDVPALRRLADDVRRQLRRARLPHDAKGFRPHLTLARPGDRVPPERLADDVARLTGYAGPTWTVEAVHLVSSVLGPNPVHTTVASARLGAAEPDGPRV